MKESTKRVGEMCAEYQTAAVKAYHTASMRHYGDDEKIKQAARAIIENARRGIIEKARPLCETRTAKDYCECALRLIEFYSDEYQKKGLI